MSRSQQKLRERLTKQGARLREVLVNYQLEIEKAIAECIDSQRSLRKAEKAAYLAFEAERNEAVANALIEGVGGPIDIGVEILNECVADLESLKKEVTDTLDALPQAIQDAETEAAEYDLG